MNLLKKYISIYEGDDCSRHLALTTSGLKSMILGEDQILGQVKDAHEFAKNICAAEISQHSFPYFRNGC
mgnify:CR=1 FL=1